MTLAWSYFGVWAVRFFFLWTLVYAENRNLLQRLINMFQWNKKYKTNLSVGNRMPKNWVDQCVCVNFLCWSGSHILKRKVQSEIWERIQSNIRRQPGTVARCCVLCILPRLDFVFLKSMVSYLSATGYKIQIYETRTPPQYDKTLLGDWQQACFARSLH